MLLQPTQIQTLLKSPASAAALQAAREHEDRIRLHADPRVAAAGRLNAPGMAQLLELPKAVLPKEKFDKLCAFIPSPLPTAKIVGQVFDGLSRLFEAQDGAVTLDMASAELETDFETFRGAQQEETFWSQKAFRAARRAPHSVLVVDMAAEQRTPRPEPYVFLLPIERVVDLVLKPDASCEYLLFKLPSRLDALGKVVERRAVYDDAAYRIFEKPEAATEWPVEPVLDNPHALGYCPARLLWSEALLDETTLDRRSPLSAQLGDLDAYVLWHACIEYFKMYGMFPPLWSIEEQCDYTPADGEACQGGIVQVLTGYNDGHPAYKAQPCPACALNKYLGPGTHVTVPSPTKETGDTREPLGFVNVPVEALKNAAATQQAARADILLSCLGADGEATTAQPRNELDVQAGFESRQDVLVRVKKNFESAEEWVLKTKGLLRYGAPAFRGVSVSRGEEFYLQTPEQLSGQLESARKSGAPVFVLSDLQEKQFFTQYRNNPPKLDRVRILSDLEPWAQYSVEQITTMIAASLTQGASYLLQVYPTERLALKADFPRYVARFESEQADVRLFAALQPYHIKLQLILTTLLSYVQPPTSPAG
ncbi:hypothetical protein [Hymenobacter nivis]|uniref:Uncharacterized protein n=1 Tax=Hymenobacter nivis TaxID=1850093 RepID=A0A502GYF9_9BACT|nr:hypothetical protein [Hymenobacter nivis]TPG66076.1 hypothetical protein EAH73_11950 [Hymenobacter nivis]